MSLKEASLLFEVYREILKQTLYRVFQDFESPTSLNLCHCKQLLFPLITQKHSSKILGQWVPANPEIIIVSSGKGSN